MARLRISCKVTKKCHWWGYIGKRNFTEYALQHGFSQSALVAVGIEVVEWRYYDMVEQSNVHEFTC